MADPLPLFPLGAVLFPGVVLPLHVFEPRYRALVQDLMTAAAQSGVPEFGVVAIRAGHEVGEGSAGGEGTLHAVGCTAVLREVGEMEDGRYAISSVGRERFRLLGISATAGTPYLTGLVERLPETDGVGPDVYARAVARRFRSYGERLGLDRDVVRDDHDPGDGAVGAEGSTDNSDDEAPSDSVSAVEASPQQLSYLVAASMVLAEPERQRLLEVPDTAARLEAELDLLRDENALIDAFSAIPGVDLAREPFTLS